MKWTIVRREMNGKESVVVSKNTLSEITKVWENYKNFAKKQGWFISKVNQFDESSDEFIEDITTGLIYSLEIR